MIFDAPTTTGPLAIQREAASRAGLTVPDATFTAAMVDGLVWLPEWGMGYCDAARRAEGVYDEEYWAKYEEYARTELGQELTQARIELVWPHRDHMGPYSTICDVGIGCGDFVAEFGCLGYDVNPIGVRWLQERNLWLDPYTEPVDAITCWDSLEHVHEPARLLRNVRSMVFASLPIFTDAEDVLRSKHFRRDEHIWYWSRSGLLKWMEAQGFRCIFHGTPESLLGRDSIDTFVFRRER